jgi:uncharacterized protein YebE (UPF0316 family)
MEFEMGSDVLINSSFFSLVILPLLIFSSRIIDVSIGTMRVIFVSRGYKLLAVICGFFEVLIWLIAITQILKNLTNPFYYLAYAGGFATGNFVGMVIEEKIALGNVLVRVVTKKEPVELTEYLKKNNYGITLLPAQGIYGAVTILFTVVPRTELENVISFIREVNPYAFYTVEDVRFINEEYYSFRHAKRLNKNRRFFKRSLRKGK